MSVKTQLNIVVGLCLDGSQSVASKFFNTRIMQVGNLQSFQRELALVLAASQFLGRISFSLYMVHEPLIFWINSIYYGMYNRPIFDHVRYGKHTFTPVFVSLCDFNMDKKRVTDHACTCPGCQCGPFPST